MISYPNNDQTIKLFIDGAMGYKFILDFKSSDLIRDVKNEICKISGISEYDQLLVLNGKELKKNATLDAYSIRKEQHLTLIITEINERYKITETNKPVIPNKTIFLNIMKPNKQKITLKCRSSDCIQMIKDIILKKENKYYENLRLMFAKRQLENDKSLDEYGIKNNDTLNLIVLKDHTDNDKIIIKTSINQILSLKNAFNLKIKTIKLMIHKETLIPICEQQLFLNDIELKNNMTLNYYDIQNNDTIFLLVKQNKESLKLFIKISSGIVMTVSCQNTTLVSKLQKKIEEAEGISVNDQQLYYCHKEWKSNDTLGDCFLENGSTINLFIRNQPNYKTIFIKTINGKYLTIDCEKCETIENIQLKVSEIEEIPAAQQVFKFAGKQLEEKNTWEIIKLKTDQQLIWL